MQYGYVRFYIPNGEYSNINSIPNEMYFDFIERSCFKWRNERDKGLCQCMYAINNTIYTLCEKPANMYTNGQWTCIHHTSHVCVPSKHPMLKYFEKKDNICNICFENISLHHFCITSCGHSFHKECLLMWTQQFTYISQICRFTCPVCRHYLHIHDAPHTYDMSIITNICVIINTYYTTYGLLIQCLFKSFILTIIPFILAYLFKNMNNM